MIFFAISVDIPAPTEYMKHVHAATSAVGRAPGSTGGFMSQSQARPDLPNLAPSELRSSVRLGTYLRRLREGYGYTLRKVEERALSYGEVIDNSQLSRFEKGKAIPSFEKLRALASIFNVSVQNFSDVLDLEEYEAFKPTDGVFGELLERGAELFARGEHGRAFVTFERALEIAEESDGQAAAEQVAEARWRMAAALKALGKLSMTEQELRTILREGARLERRTRVRSLLQLLFVYRELGDRYLAGVMARECLDLAAEDGDLVTEAAVRNALGNIQHDEQDFEGALASYTRAHELLEQLGTQEEMRITVLTNVGGCLVALRRFDEGVARIGEAHRRAMARGFRRVAALALTRLGEASLKRSDHESARQAFLDSDALASRPEESYTDILFLNAYRRWEMARQEGNGTREKIAFGRLRHLRSRLERRFPEVDEFDRYVERTRRKHAIPS